MIAWWWAPVLLVAGACIGALIMGVIVFDNVTTKRERLKVVKKREQHGKGSG